MSGWLGGAELVEQRQEDTELCWIFQARSNTGMAPGRHEKLGIRGGGGGSEGREDWIGKGLQVGGPECDGIQLRDFRGGGGEGGAVRRSIQKPKSDSRVDKRKSWAEEVDRESDMPVDDDGRLAMGLRALHAGTEASKSSGSAAGQGKVWALRELQRRLLRPREGHWWQFQQTGHASSMPCAAPFGYGIRWGRCGVS